MNKNKNAQMEAFRLLDAAPSGSLNESERIKANAGLQQILASDPDNGRVTDHRSHALRSHPVRRIATPVAVALAAAVTATVVLFPGPGANDAAYASWTADPGTISAADRAVADSACRGRLDLASAQLDLAERRGEWVVLLYTASSEHMAGMCLAHLPVGAPQADTIDSSRAGGDQGFLPVGGEFTEGNIAEFRGRNAFGFPKRPDVALTHGNVGEDVKAVSITTPDGQVVEATVQDGRYAAWWPGKAFGSRLEGNGGPAPALSYTITLEDDTVIRDASPRNPA